MSEHAKALKRVIDQAVRGGLHSERLSGGGYVEAMARPIGGRMGVSYISEPAKGPSDSGWMANGPRKVT